MIFQPIGGSGSGGGLTVKTGVFALNASNRTISLGFEAKACIVICDKSAENAGFLVAGGSTNISAGGGELATEVSLSSDGMTLRSEYYIDGGIRYLALG